MNCSCRVQKMLDTQSSREDAEKRNGKSKETHKEKKGKTQEKQQRKNMNNSSTCFALCFFPFFNIPFCSLHFFIFSILLFSACVVLLTLHLCTVFFQRSCTHPSALHLMTLLYLCIKAQTQKHTAHWTHLAACFLFFSSFFSLSMFTCFSFLFSCCHVSVFLHFSISPHHLFFLFLLFFGHCWPCGHQQSSDFPQQQSL